MNPDEFTRHLAANLILAARDKTVDDWQWSNVVLPFCDVKIPDYPPALTVSESIGYWRRMLNSGPWKNGNESS